ncbi:hypothetical protein [Streptomyces wedmorensis]
MAADGGRIAARGFQYQYLRTVEALLACANNGEVAVCRVEGPGAVLSLSHADSVDFDLTDAAGRSVMAVQVKSAGAGRVTTVREVVSVLLRLITSFDSAQYRLITSAAPDEGCLRLAELLARHGSDVAVLKAQLKLLLGRSQAVWAICEALPEEHWARLGRGGVEFDGRSDVQLREDLNQGLRTQREAAGLGLSRRSGGLVLGFLVAEAMRRAADPASAHWDVQDFRRSVALGDEELISAVGRQAFGIVYGQIPPLPEVERGDLVDRVSEVLSADSAGGVRTCVISGLSGLGKSSLAAAYVADQAFRYDSVFWVEGDSEEALVASFTRVLVYLTGSPRQGETSDPRLLRERVHAELQALPGSWLMVFDDANASAARAWLPRRGRGRTLVTTLGGHWHAAHGRIDLGPMSGAEAMCLLRLRLGLSEAEAVRHTASLSRLALVLEYWPLAIEVACGYLVTCGIGVERVAAYTDTLVSRAADDEQAVPSGYPRTLAAAVGVSIERLVESARARGLLPTTLAMIAALCRLAPRRAPVHLALASAFIDPDDMPAGASWVVFDEAQVPVREVIRELLNVSVVRLDEALPAREEAFPGSEDTVSMNTVLQELVSRHLGLARPAMTGGLSELAFHTDRWLRGALLTGQAERSWELAQHAGALVGHIQAAQIVDEHTALLMGNLAAFHQAHGQYEAARELLELELEWLDRAGDPDPGLRAQASVMLAQLVLLRQDSDAVPGLLRYLSPVLCYLQGLEGPPDEQVSELATAAAMIVQMQLRTGSDEGLVRLLEAFRDLAHGGPPSERTQAAMELFAIQELLQQSGGAERAEKAILTALSKVSEPWSAHAADLKRLLVEALARQDKWEQASSALTDFLPYAGPHTLHGQAVHHLVHNVGCECAWKWVLTGDVRAVSLLGRLLDETGVLEHPVFETAIDVARFTLLRVAHTGWRAMTEEGGSSTVMELMRQLTDKTFTDPHDPGNVWERIYAGLSPRFAGVASETIHRWQQDEAAAIMASGLPLFEQDPVLRDEFIRARCHALLFLSSDPVYGGLAGRSSLEVLLSESRSFLQRPRAVAILQPRTVIGMTSMDTGESVEVQLHRACEKGMRQFVGPRPTVPSPPHVTLVLSGQKLVLRHDDGTVIASATVSSSSQWRQAARARSNVLVYYGYGFALHHSPTHQQLVASPAALRESLEEACDSGLLAGGLVSVRLQSEPAAPQARPASERKQPRSTSRARRRKR